MRRLGLAILAIAISLCFGSIAFALDNVKTLLLFGQQSAVHDGISLNFATGVHYVKAPGQAAQYGAFNSLFAFTRNSLGTYRAQSGNIVFANENQFQFSEDISNAFWSKNAATVTANTTTAPDGTATADTLTADAGAGTLPRYADTSALTFTGAVSVASVYAKAGTYNFVQIYVNSQAGDFANFNVSTCALGTTAGTGTATASPVGNGWCRISMSYIAGGDDRRPFFLISAGASATRAQTWSPAGTETVFFWGSQHQWGQLGPYLPATGAAKKYDQPRVEYDASGNNLGLLIEGTRTNLILQSEAFDNASWAKGQSSITADQIASPAGTVTGDQLIENNANANHRAETGSTTVTANVNYTFSIFVKAKERTAGALLFADFATGLVGCYTDFNLTAGTVSGGVALSTGTFVGASIAPYASGWYRVTLTCNIGGAVTAAFARVSLANPVGTPSYLGDSVSGFYIWGADLEQGSFPSSYTPTTTAAVTRASDVASRTLGAEFNASVGTLFTEADVAATSSVGATPAIASFSDGNTNVNEITAYRNGGDARWFIIAASASQANILNTPAADGVLSKHAGTYALNDFQAALNGVLGTADVSGTVPGSITTLYLMRQGSTQITVGHLRRLDYYPARMPNDFLQSKTQPGPQTMLTPANDNERRAYG